MTHRRVRIAIIIPAGPRDDLMDTLASVIFYSDESRVVVVVDDTMTLGNDLHAIRKLSSDIFVIPAPPRAAGGDGGLWVKLAAGYRWVLERYQPGIILRLDADAMIIGRGLEMRAEQAFSVLPDVGLLGACRIGPDGGARDPSWAARELEIETGLRWLRYPRCRKALRYFLKLARHNGYIYGESALGGAYIHSYQAAFEIYRRGWFNQPWLAPSFLGEDHIMSMLTRAAGYDLGEFSGPADPMALKWKGLPADPLELLARGKLVTHSVRFWEDLNERQVRDIFARARQQESLKMNYDDHEIS